MVIARTAEGDVGVLRDHAPLLSLLVRRRRRDPRRSTATTWSPPSTAASSRSPTTGSRSCREHAVLAARDRRRRRRGPSSRRPRSDGGDEDARQPGRAAPRPGSGRPRRPPDPSRRASLPPRVPLGWRRPPCPRVALDGGRGWMPVWQWLLDAAGVLLLLVLLYGVAPDRPPPRAVPPRRHLRAQLPRPAREGRARLASRARPLLRRDAGVVPDLLAVAAAQAGLAALGADLRRPPRAPRAPSRCRSTPTTS